MIYTENEAKLQNIGNLRETISTKFNRLVIFDQMLFEILKLSNQYNCIDGNCFLIGRRGVGKKYTLSASAAINKEVI